MEHYRYPPRELGWNIPGGEGDILQKRQDMLGSDLPEVFQGKFRSRLRGWSDSSGGHPGEDKGGEGGDTEENPPETN